MGFLSGHAAMPPKSLQSARPRRRTEDGWSRAALSQHPACPNALHCDAVFPV
ncbi:hypothetical protein COLSTE_00695 [Collinsella stercoris DSM 13279]|uniref:Uncharacterized protein n=1 Tax=Collinsella stercoris DSM 13279 TaxID=445975 RepID=B6G9F3_9ACTN|nr:hypothetical protein COLSTE_00695 [Collinsella stercoris DSM 13279]